MAPGKRTWSSADVAVLIADRMSMALAYAASRCGPGDAEEAVDESIVILTEKIGEGEYAIASEGEAWTLFCRVLQTQARNLRTRALRFSRFEFDGDRDGQLRERKEPDPSCELEHRERMQLLRDAIEELDSQLKTVLLRRLNDDRVMDIAADLEVSPATVSRLHGQAIAALRACLETPMHEH